MIESANFVALAAALSRHTGYGKWPRRQLKLELRTVVTHCLLRAEESFAATGISSIGVCRSLTTFIALQSALRLTTASAARPDGARIVGEARRRRAIRGCARLSACMRRRACVFTHAAHAGGRGPQTDGPTTRSVGTVHYCNVSLLYQRLSAERPTAYSSHLPPARLASRLSRLAGPVVNGGRRVRVYGQPSVRTNQ